MREDMITTSTGEIERLRINQKMMKRRWTQVTMAERIAATNRDVRRTLEQAREKGTKY